MSVLALVIVACGVSGFSGVEPTTRVNPIWLRGTAASSATGEPIEGVQVGFTYDRGGFGLSPSSGPSPIYSDPTGADGVFDFEFDAGTFRGDWNCRSFPRGLIARTDSAPVGRPVSHRPIPAAMVECTSEVQVFHFEVEEDGEYWIRP